MSRICELTGKKPVVGYSVSKSNKKTKRRFYPNLHKKRFFIPELNEWVSLKVSTTALKTINRKGIYSFVREMEEKRGIKILKN